MHYKKRENAPLFSFQNPFFEVYLRYVIELQTPLKQDCGKVIFNIEFAFTY